MSSKNARDIMTDGPAVALARLDALARREGATVLPAGAGGGDVALFVGSAAPSAALRALALELGQKQLALELGARGVHGADVSAT